jgi:hypothetical protein
MTGQCQAVASRVGQGGSNPLLASTSAYLARDAQDRLGISSNIPSSGGIGSRDGTTQLGTDRLFTVRFGTAVDDAEGPLHTVTTDSARDAEDTE